MSHGPRIIDAEQMTAPTSGLWKHLHILGFAMAIVGALMSFALKGDDPKQLAFSWLVAFLYFMSLGLGALFFVLIQFATKSGWGVVVRRVAEHASTGLIALGLAFIPIYLWLETIYSHWADTAHLDDIVRGKTPYLNSNRFLIFAIAYFVIWAFLASKFRNGSVRQDATGNTDITRSLIKWAGPGIMLFALTTTFASFDWAMSLTPHWYSTIFGVYFFAGSLVAVFAFVSLVVLRLQANGRLQGVVTAEHRQDLGKLLFAFIVFWAYIGFSQYFLIWYGNIPEETEWYLERGHGSWGTITMILALCHFIVPFFLLMSRHVKRNRLGLGFFSAYMLVMHFVDLHWIVMPTLHHDGFSPSILDLTTMLTIGGLFLAAFGLSAKGSKLVPVRDPRLLESITFENF